MANHLLRLGQRQLLRLQAMPSQSVAAYHGKSRIGNREVVGYGMNGEYMYIDRADFPMPAIRYKEESSDVKALREKEKGDWKKLSIDEKKALYRASFCQTYAEMNAPSGEWKPSLAALMGAMALTLWVYVFMKKCVYGPIPESFTPEAKAAQLQRIVDLRVNPIDGIASKYDYENNRWK